jgi:hypothetical protein
MPQHRPSVGCEETSVAMPVIDLSGNPVYGAAAKWLKEQRRGQQ